MSQQLGLFTHSHYHHHDPCVSAWAQLELRAHSVVDLRSAALPVCGVDCLMALMLLPELHHEHGLIDVWHSVCTVFAEGCVSGLHSCPWDWSQQ